MPWQAKQTRKEKKKKKKIDMQRLIDQYRHFQPPSIYPNLFVNAGFDHLVVVTESPDSIIYRSAESLEYPVNGMTA
jgi:hypothetical protein